MLNAGFNILDDVEDIDVDVDIELAKSEQNKRFSLNKQIDSMLDDLLARVPSNERSKQKINEINKNIIRFKRIKTIFSNFQEDGNIENPKYKHFNKDFKPLIRKFKNIK